MSQTEELVNTDFSLIFVKKSQVFALTSVIFHSFLWTDLMSRCCVRLGRLVSVAAQVRLTSSC